MENDKSKSTERVVHDVNVEKMFQEYLKKWNEETINMSSSDMFENKYYHAIISLGREAIPCIINQLRKEPDHLFKALKMITGISPIKPEHAGRLYDMARDWIDWYDKNSI
jgi:hypothetical protein